MTSNELRELVKSHFNLVDAEVTTTEIEETFSEETVEETVEESFGEIADENSAFVLRFPGEELAVGDKVTVVTTDGQEMDAPDGEHKLAGGVEIVTKDSVVESIEKPVAETSEEVEEAPAAETTEEEDAELIEEEMAEEGAEEVAEEEMEEEAEEEIAEEAMEEEAEPTVDAEAIIKAIADEITAEMGKLKEKMEALEEKVVAVESAPAAEPTRMSSEKKSAFSKFDVAQAKNSKDMELALRMIKNKK